MLTAAAAVVFGMQDMLTQQLVRRLEHGDAALLVSWPLWGVIAAAVVGLTLSQNAFSTADLSASLPALTHGRARDRTAPVDRPSARG